MAESDKMALQFAPFSSAIEGGFWHQLTQKILDVYALDDKPRSINGYYSNHEAEGIPPAVNIDYGAFKEQFDVPIRCFLSHGTLLNKNTIEEYKNCDKNAIIEAEGNRIWTDILNGNAIADPSLLSRFLMLTFADLKKYHYYYWFAFPAIPFASGVNLLNEVKTLEQRFSESQVQSLIGQNETLCSTNQMSAFLIHESLDQSISVGRLSDFSSLKNILGKILIGFSDPSNLPSHPGWPLRNLLYLVAYNWREQLSDHSVEVLCWRQRFKDGQRQTSHSIVLHVSLPEVPRISAITNLPQEQIKIVGWERNDKQKLGPRFLDLSSSMDPTRLAESAVDLNLKLMRWRLLPELNLDLISSSRCLLLGAGTLGCNVARCLLGWGVRNITLVDYGSVSYSNPVRQSLFEFSDSLQGGKFKALTAADALKRIFPGVNAVGLNLSIPMPGHSIPDVMMEQTRRDVETLESVIESHDAVVLLMDTRESRWLPTLIAKHKHKSDFFALINSPSSEVLMVNDGGTLEIELVQEFIAISAALGFDTYLVVRHGVGLSDTSSGTNEDGARAGPATMQASDWMKPIPGGELGCYFCNDVVAPGNSTRDRTLDQQCTVSRPGLSMMTSALTVELLVSLLVHPLKGEALASVTSGEDEKPDELSVLGVIPHQIRGFLSSFQQMTPACRAFNHCTACSDKVLEAYEREGFSFLLNVFNKPSSFLEDLTGLTQLHADTANIDEICLMTDDEDF